MKSIVFSMEREIVISQLIEQIAELVEQQKEINLAIEDKLFQIKCVVAKNKDKIHINTHAKEMT